MKRSEKSISKFDGFCRVSQLADTPGENMQIHEGWMGLCRVSKQVKYKRSSRDLHQELVTCQLRSVIKEYNHHWAYNTNHEYHKHQPLHQKYMYVQQNSNKPRAIFKEQYRSISGVLVKRVNGVPDRQTSEQEQCKQQNVHIVLNIHDQLVSCILHIQGIIYKM